MKKRMLTIFVIISMSEPIYPMSLDQATYKVGTRFFEQGLYTEAEPRFLDIVRKYPDSSFYRNSLFYLGQTYAHQGKYKSALQYYKVLLNKSRTIKEKQQALLGISKSWLQLGNHDKAADFYSFYAAEYPESEYTPAALYFAGIARERENNIPAAVEKYRAVLEMYPNSDYYSKSIEKVAVLNSNTPETLWQENLVSRSMPDQGDIRLFAEDEFTIDEAPGSSLDISSQSSRDSTVYLQNATSTFQVSPTAVTQIVPIVPQVITQLIPSPPIIITQAPIVITQQIKEFIPQNLGSTMSTNISQLPQDVQKMMDSSVVYLSNNKYVAEETVQDREKRKELEAYKKQWEEEFLLKLKEKELQQAQNSIKEMARLADKKAQVLQIKEQTLQEKQNQIRSSLLIELKGIEAKENYREFSTPPIFTGGVSTENNVPSVDVAQDKVVVEDVPIEESEENITTPDAEYAEDTPYEYADGEYVDTAYDEEYDYEEYDEQQTE